MCLDLMLQNRNATSESNYVFQFNYLLNQIAQTVAKSYHGYSWSSFNLRKYFSMNRAALCVASGVLAW